MNFWKYGVGFRIQKFIAISFNLIFFYIIFIDIFGWKHTMVIPFGPFLGLVL
jgi:hypothetical protein